MDLSKLRLGAQPIGGVVGLAGSGPAGSSDTGGVVFLKKRSRPAAAAAPPTVASPPPATAAIAATAADAAAEPLAPAAAAAPAAAPGADGTAEQTVQSSGTAEDGAGEKKSQHVAPVSFAAAAAAARRAAGGPAPAAAPAASPAAAAASVRPGLPLRGLRNEGNTCFMNAPLQLLLHVRLLSRALLEGPTAMLIDYPPAPQRTLPLCSAFKALLASFYLAEARRPASVSREQWLSRQQPLSATKLYAAILALNPSLRQTEGARQHDAEELLTFILHTMHDELAAAAATTPDGNGNVLDNGIADAGDTPEHSDDDGWTEIGPRGKAAALDKLDLASTTVSRLFKGTLRSTVQRASAKQRHKLEPFFCLQVSLESPAIKSLSDAIRATLSSETLESDTHVGATKQLVLESLPPVLLLHLKRFTFTPAGGVKKIERHLPFPEELVIQKEWLSHAGRDKHAGDKYKLQGVVLHFGGTAEQGHYTSVLRTDDCGWVEFNDHRLIPVMPGEVFGGGNPGVPYILCYVNASIA